MATELETQYYNHTLPCRSCGKRLQADGYCENCEDFGDDYDERYQEE